MTIKTTCYDKVVIVDNSVEIGDYLKNMFSNAA